MNEAYWKKFYSRSHTLNPSPFVEWAGSIKGLRVIDFGCGNGRDTYHLLRNNDVIGVDPCAPEGPLFVRSTIEEFLETKPFAEVAYCRFLFHACEKSTQDAILDWAKFNGAKLYAEFRSDKDTPPPGHDRRLINGSEFLKDLLERGFHIVFYEERIGLAKFENEDPMIIRVIAEPIIKDIPSHILLGVNHDLALQNLKDTKEVLDSTGTHFWLAYGTLLGCMREQDFIAHDYDIDLFVWEDRSNMKKIIEAMIDKGFRLKIKLVSATDGSWYQFHALKGSVGGLCHVDIWTMVRKENSTYSNFFGKRMVWSSISEFVSVDFLGMQFMIPSNWEQNLTDNYGDWKTVDKGWNTNMSKNFAKRNNE